MFNTEELYADVGGEILRRRGKQVTQELLSAMMGLQGHVALQIMIDWHQLDTTAQQLQAESDEIFDSFLDERLKPLPGLLSLLETLEEQQIPKAITTSSRRRFVDRCLQIAELDGRFHFVLAAEDIRQGKPHPEIYSTAAQRFSVEAGAMLVLEDSQNGVRAAIDSGAFAVAVPGGHSREHDFSGARFVADNLADARIYQALGIT